MALWLFPKGWLLRWGQKPKSHLRADIKLFLKNVGGKNIKNNLSAMSVGLLAVRFQYGLYVVVHLSKFVSLFCVFTRLMSAMSFRFTQAANGLRVEDVA